MKAQEQSRKVLISGGGLAGLAAADKLLDAGFSVKILEGAPFLGGLASSFIRDGQEIPRFNHHVVKSNKTTLKYLNRYHLMGHNKWQRVRMGVGVKDKLHNINSPFGLLGFNYLSFWGRFRLGLFGLYAIFLMNPKRIDENLDLDTWMDRYAGKEAKKFWHQMYGRNKFNISLKKISAKQFAHRLHEKEGYDLFTFPMRGLQGMIDGLEHDVKKRHGQIEYPVRIEHVDVKKKTVTYSRKDGTSHTEQYDSLVNTIPVPELIKITSGVPRHYVKNIKKLRYTPVVGLAFGTKDFLNEKMYWINLLHERVHVIYQHSVLVDKYRSKVTWCVRYGGSAEDISLSDDQIKDEYIACLRKYFPDMDLEWCLVFRDRYAEPIYDKDYASYAPTYETPVPGLYNAGIQVTFPKIRNMDVALESGEIVAKKIIEKYS